MNDLNKMFIVQWYGTFISLEELKNWEKIQNASFQFNLYIITGVEKYQRAYSHYCGMNLFIKD